MLTLSVHLRNNYFSLQINHVKQAECKERVNIVSRYSDELMQWKVQEQKKIERLHEDRLREKSQEMEDMICRNRENLKYLNSKLELLTHQSEQKELQLTVERDEQAACVGKLQEEVRKSVSC